MFGSKVKSLLSDSAYLQLQTCNKQLNPQSLTLSWVETDEVFTLKPECYVRRTLRYDRCLSAKKRQKSFTQQHINCSLVSLGLCSVCFCIKWHNYCWFFSLPPTDNMITGPKYWRLLLGLTLVATLGMHVYVGLKLPRTWTCLGFRIQVQWSMWGKNLDGKVNEMFTFC